MKHRQHIDMAHLSSALGATALTLLVACKGMPDQTASYPQGTTPPSATQLVIPPEASPAPAPEPPPWHIPHNAKGSATSSLPASPAFVIPPEASPAPAPAPPPHGAKGAAVAKSSVPPAAEPATGGRSKAVKQSGASLGNTVDPKKASQPVKAEPQSDAGSSAKKHR